MAKKSHPVSPRSTVSAPSRYMSRNPESLLDLESITAPDIETSLRGYEAQGRKDVRVAFNHRADPPYDAPGKLMYALKRLEATASPEDCPLAGYAEEAYEAYLDGFFSAMEAYYASIRFTVPAWAENTLASLEQERKFLSLSDLMVGIRKPKVTTANPSTPAPAGL